MIADGRKLWSGDIPSDMVSAEHNSSREFVEHIQKGMKSFASQMAWRNPAQEPVIASFHKTLLEHCGGAKS